MSELPAALKRELLKERYAIEDAARELIRRIIDEIGMSADLREEARYLAAKGDVFFGGIEDLLFFDPSERSADADELRVLRRQSDELFLARAELDRKVRDARRRAVEVEEQVKVDRAHRHANELQIEISRVDGGAQPT